LRFKASLGKNIHQIPHLNSKSSEWQCTPAISAAAGSNHGPGGPRQKVKAYLNNDQSIKGLEVWFKPFLKF
jgi:hypothetical protein